jgi:membrane fusion protein (multidrug efflux system)
VRVEVPVGTPRESVVIPASALRRGPGGDFVFVIREDEQGKSRAHQRTVQVAALSGDDVVISDGIEAGERVAASGSFKLRESALVAVANPAPAARVASGG